MGEKESEPNGRESQERTKGNNRYLKISQGRKEGGRMGRRKGAERNSSSQVQGVKREGGPNVETNAFSGSESYIPHYRARRKKRKAQGKGRYVPAA